MCISTRLESEIDRASALRVKLRKRSKPYSQRLLCLYHLRQFVIPEARRFLLSADSPFVIRRRALLESHPMQGQAHRLDRGVIRGGSTSSGGEFEPDPHAAAG